MKPVKRRDDVPEGYDPLGVPRAGAGIDALIMVTALVAALAGLIVTVATVVFYQLN